MDANQDPCHTIDDVLQSFLHPADSDDIEWHLSEQDTTSGAIPVTECATLHLCNGISCLIIQLLHLSSILLS
ncbi:hypothetical protein CR513_20885, partial [Mucuna pruriens]